MIIKNALIYTENHRFEKKDVRIRNERITEICFILPLHVQKKW